MGSRADEFKLSVMMGLRRGLSLIRGARRTFNEDEQHKIADAIVQHLKSHNWRVEPGPERAGHGPNMPK